MNTKTISLPFSKIPHLFLDLFQKLRSYQRKRRRMLFLSHFNIPKDGSLLDISCGGGFILSLFHSHSPSVRLFGVDMCKKNIEKAKTNHPMAVYTVAQAEYLPYQEEKFDVVVSCNALHHYNDPQKVFEEVSRVLSHGGTFYLHDIFPKNRFQQWVQNMHGCSEPYHFEKYYTKRDIESLANSMGFSLDTHTRTGWFSDTQVMGLKKIR